MPLLGKEDVTDRMREVAEGSEEEERKDRAAREKSEEVFFFVGVRVRVVEWVIERD